MGGELVKETQHGLAFEVPFGRHVKEVGAPMRETAFSQVECDRPAKLVLVDTRNWVRDALRFYTEQWKIELVVCAVVDLIATLRNEGPSVQWLCIGSEIELNFDVHLLATQYPSVLLVYFASVRSQTRPAGFDDTIELPLLLSQLHRILSRRKAVTAAPVGPASDAPKRKRDDQS